MKITLLIVYNFIIILISFIMNRRARDFSDFVVAGRSLSIIAVAFTLVASKMGAGIIIGTTAMAASSGLLAILYPLSSTAGFLVLGFTIGEKYRKIGIYTVPQFIEQKYGPTCSIISAIVLFLSLCFVLSVQFIAGGIILNTFINTTPAFSIVLFALLIIIFVYFGGMWGVAFTDFFQFILIFIGLSMLAWRSAILAGGFTYIIHDNLNSINGVQPIPWDTIVAWFLTSITVVLTSQGFVQRMSAAKNPITARWASILAGILVIPVGIFVTIIGLGTSYINTKVVGQQALIYQAEMLHPFLSALLLVAVYTIITSSAENILHSFAIITSQDIVQRIVLKNADKLLIVRIMTIICGMLTMMVALYNKKDIINGLVFGAGIAGIGLFAPIMAAFYWKQVPKAALASMISSLTIMLLSLIIPIESFLDPTILALIISCFVFIVVTIRYSTKKASISPLNVSRN